MKKITYLMIGTLLTSSAMAAPEPDCKTSKVNCWKSSKCMVTMTAKDLLRKSIMASPYITTLIDGKLDIVPTTVSNKIRRGVFLGHNRSTKILTEYNSSNLSITRVRMIPVDDSIDDESITVESFEQNPNVIDCGTFNQEQ